MLTLPDSKTAHDEWVLLNPGPADTSFTIRHALLMQEYDPAVRSDGPLEACADAVLATLRVVREGVPR